MDMTISKIHQHQFWLKKLRVFSYSALPIPIKYGLIFLPGCLLSCAILYFHPLPHAELPLLQKKLLILGLTIPTTLALMITVFILPIFTKNRNWSLYQKLVYLIYTLNLIFVFNTIYALLFFKPIFKEMNILSLWGVIISSASFGTIYPLLLARAHLQRNRTREGKQLSSSISHFPQTVKHTPNAHLRFITFYSKNHREIFRVREKDLIFLRALENYVAIYYLSNHHLAKYLIRNTLKNIEKQLSKHKTIARCHKSYIVNLNRVQDIQGNAKGYKLTLDFVPEKIPVSRTWYSNILPFVSPDPLREREKDTVV